MSRETLNAKFWQASKILRQDDNTNSLLDYVEQISWLLFLKCFEELEDQRRAEAEYEGKTYKPIVAEEYQWSSWTDPERRLTSSALIEFLADKLFPYLRTVQSGEESAIIRSMFAETPSKMLKDGGILRDAIDVINDIEFQTAEDVHTLSHLYESMLAKLGREGGMGGEFYTPRPIIEFVVKMVDPKLGETVYDPAMGSAGFLVEAHRYMRDNLGDQITLEDERRLQQETFFGQEKKPLPYLLGCMNMVLHGVLTPSLKRRNTLADDVRKFTEKDRFHVILTNPPFGGTERDSVTANFRYGSKATSITFMQHIMEKVRRGGRVGMVIDDGVLFKTGERAYVDTKKELLEKFNLHTIVSLPAGVFANAVASGTGPKTSLLFFNREVDERGEPVGTKEIWYYEVDAVGFSLTKTQRPVPENDLPDCLAKARNCAVSTRSWVVPVEDVMDRNYDLSSHNPNRKDDVERRSPEALAVEISASKTHLNSLIEHLQGSTLKWLNQYEESWSNLHNWVEVPLTEILEQQKERINISDSETYKQLTGSMRGKGVKLRQAVLGSSIKTKGQYVARAGQFIYSRIDARNGAMGIVPDELDGGIVTGDFPVFNINIEKVDARFFSLYVTRPFFVELCEKQAVESPIVED